MSRAEDASAPDQRTGIPRSAGIPLHNNERNLSMISVDSPPVPVQPVAPQRPVVLEHAICCSADVEHAVNSILSSMRQYPFAASDGFAVQMALTEAIQQSLESQPENAPRQIRLRTHITPSYIRIQIEDVEIPTLQGTSRPPILPENLNRRFSLARTYMTNVEFRKQGRQIILYRVKGQGSAISGPPIGYDFQI